MLQNNRQHEYKKLTLGGFQTFSDDTDFPLGKLTFLFGPNSAGKSAVEDGFSFLLKLSDRKVPFAVTGIRGFGNLEKYFRKVSDEPLIYAPSLKIGFASKICSSNFAAIIKKFSSDKNIDAYINKQEGHTVEYQSEFPLHIDENPDFIDLARTTGLLINFFLDEIPLFKLHLKDQGGMGLNLNHPLAQILGLLQGVTKVPDGLERATSIENGWLWVYGDFYPDREGKIYTGWHPSQEERDAMASALSFFPELKPTIEGFLIHLYEFLGLEYFQYSLVHASRTIPSSTDLLFFSDARRGEYYLGLQMDKYPMPEIGNNIYRSLAESLVAPTTTSLSQSYYGYIEREETSYLSDHVNRLLSEYLFIERGYRVAADYRLLLSHKQYDDEKKHGNLTAGDFPLLIRVFLKDSQGREFSFSEVGSGLGYVLPVLVSIFGEEKLSIIQQPELHLHPALQAAMGDVFIDACNHGKQLIVETHSEHLLLRVLKRIRQTSAGTLLDEKLQLNPEDLSVLYFDPSPDGTTKVKRLRVSPDGDFLDPWPRGFFTERDQELFGE